MDNCLVPSGGRRRTFWTTQLSCGTSEQCGDECGKPGLQYIDEENGRTIATNDWVRSLVINILMTDARVENSACGVRPNAIGGHWSDSYRQGYAGSRMRQVGTTGRVQDAINLINAHIVNDMNKLIDYGVAESVNVETKYLGSNRVSVVIEVVGPPSGGDGRVALEGSRLGNGWVWS